MTRKRQDSAFISADSRSPNRSWSPSTLLLYRVYWLEPYLSGMVTALMGTDEPFRGWWGLLSGPWVPHFPLCMTYTARYTISARRLIKDPHHPCNCLWPSGQAVACAVIKHAQRGWDTVFSCGNQSPKLCTLNNNKKMFLLYCILLYLLYSTVFYLHRIIFLFLLKLSTEVQYMSQKHFTAHSVWACDK